MTGGAFFRRRLVKNYSLPFHKSLLFVACLTTHIAMNTLQRESSFVVVEQRRLPLVAVVTVRAVGGLILCKLLSVNILVTAFTLVGCRFEIHVDQAGLKVCGLVAIDTRGGAMSAQ